MRAMTRVLIGLSLLLMQVTISFADSPKRPYDYTVETKNAQFEFRMFAPDTDSSDTTNRNSGLYPNNTDSTDPLWSVDWYAFNVIPHSNGQHLVRQGPWASGTAELAVAFYKEGEELTSYRISDLITDESKLQYSVSHFQWRSEIIYEEDKDSLTISTLDGNRYVFSLLTGELTDSRKTEHSDLAKLKALVKRQPEQMQFAAKSVLDNRQSLIQLIRINESVFYYLPEALKNDRAFALDSVKAMGVVYKYLPEIFQNDQEFVSEALTSSGYSLDLDDVSSKISVSKFQIYAAVKRDRLNYWGIGEPWNKDPELLRLALRSNSGFHVYRYAHISLQKRRDIVLDTIAAELKSQQADFDRIQKTKAKYSAEELKRYDLTMDTVERVAHVPYRYLDDREVMEEFDKVLLLLVEQDKTKLPDIRKKAYSLIRDRDQRRIEAELFLERMTEFVDQSDVVGNEAARKRWVQGVYAWFENEGLEFDYTFEQVLGGLMRAFTPSGSTHAINEDQVHRMVSASVYSKQINRLNSSDFVSAMGAWNKKYLSGDLLPREEREFRFCSRCWV